MTRILVMSDSHGDVIDMVESYRKEKPDMVIHLGDCVRDLDRFREQCPEAHVEGVPGNCDMTFDQPTRLLLIEGFRVMITHGHMFHVKSSYLSLSLGAAERNADIALFGHTHHVFYEDRNGILLFNPGSIGSPPSGIPRSYGILVLDADSKTKKYEVKYLSDEA